MVTTLALLAMVAATASQPADTLRIDVSGGSRVWIEGSSNIAGWSCKATRFTATVDSGRVAIRLAARDLECGNRRMDRDLYAALKATDPTTPSWIVAKFDASGAPTDGAMMETPGSLEVVGIVKSVVAKISTERTTAGEVRAKGSVPLLMTDFGVKPPVGLLGLIRSRNEVLVRFELVMK
jgi:polyisoprenoid-binding protein YceI